MRMQNTYAEGLTIFSKTYALELITKGDAPPVSIGRHEISVFGKKQPT